MKFRGANTLPPSIALWLEQQLELRGIDSVVYSRYIISLLNDETFDLNEHSKGNKKLTSWKSCNLEELKRSAVIQCLTEAADQAFEIENLVDELCAKLKEVESEDDKCLKENTNSENVFNFNSQVSSLDLASRYYSAFPALSKGISLENTFPLTSVWSRNICRALGGGRKRGDSESSSKDNKISKRKDNKENVLSGGITGGVRRMRSRSTVKQSSGHYRNRGLAAKSLDRKEDEINSTMKRCYGATKSLFGADVGSTDKSIASEETGTGMGDPRGRKCLNFNSVEHKALGQLLGYSLSSAIYFEGLASSHHRDQLSRTPGRKSNRRENYLNNGEVIEDNCSAECDDSAELSFDFQYLLKSPPMEVTGSSAASSLYKMPESLSSVWSDAPSSNRNFIQCGTNITSSIWSTGTEKMDEDESGVGFGVWENVGDNANKGIPTGGNSKWSDARSSILSSAWKLPFVYDKDIEGTTLAVNASSGSFYSCFDTGTNPALFLKSNDNNVSKVEENKVGQVENKSTLLSNEEEEEDLLTSMKTHFRPIKNNDHGCCTDGQKEGDAMEGIIVGTDGAYKDGSTFTDTSASPAKLEYNRSESGALYLATTGEKYFEFKRSTPNHLNSQKSQENSSSSEIFVPKFKVRQNEKFCQTDDSPPSDPERDAFPRTSYLPKWLAWPNGYLSSDGDRNDQDDEDTYDAGDNLFEESKNLDEKSSQTIKISGTVSSWPITAMDFSCPEWSFGYTINDNAAKAWMSSDNNNGRAGVKDIVQDCTDQPENYRMVDRIDNYHRLKNEVLEEAEKLLSDVIIAKDLYLGAELMESFPHRQKAVQSSEL